MTGSQRKLLEIALRQGGFFTSKQAVSAGILRENHTRFLSSGEWEKEFKSVYRMTSIPRGKLSEFFAVILWASDRNGNIVGIFSHETALWLYELSDLMPSKIHLTMPVGTKRTFIPKVARLHFESVATEDVSIWEGLRVIRPAKTIVTLLQEGRVSHEHIEKAFSDAIRLGYLKQAELKKIDMSRKEEILLDSWWKLYGY